MTGLVLWESSANQTDAVQLEYLSLGYNDVVNQKGVYDWGRVEQHLKAIEARKHQAVLRFYETMPGQRTTVPDYIKKLNGYEDKVAKSEGKDTYFPDWSNSEYQRFISEFYERLAKKYDEDKRLAFLQIGFGLWAEYHIYSGPELPGETFPSLDFQTGFLKNVAKSFKLTPWMISQDAHVGTRAPFTSKPELLKLTFGVFDDTFHRAWAPGYNAEGWEFFGRQRSHYAPAGGELPDPDGGKILTSLGTAHWAEKTRQFGITFMLGGDWLRLMPPQAVTEYGLACGYKFKVTAFVASANVSRLRVTNIGAAPIYFDAFLTVNGIRSKDSLKGLLPGEERGFIVQTGGPAPKLILESDRLVAGQHIEFEASLK
jgi:hypothetical protein